MFAAEKTEKIFLKKNKKKQTHEISQDCELYNTLPCPNMLFKGMLRSFKTVGQIYYITATAFAKGCLQRSWNFCGGWEILA